MARAPRSLAGQVVAITGGARGLGRATASALITQGARVAIGDIDAALAMLTASQLASGTVGFALDVTDRASFETFLEAVEAQLGPLDVLINNAGVMPVGRFVEESDATAQRMVDINLHGVIFGSKLALARFGPRGRGHLVNVASSAGKAGLPGGATYCATKHAVVGLSEAIRHEVRGTAIGVSVVMPVLAKTELGAGFPEMRAFNPVEPEDVADAIVHALQTGRFDVYVPKSLGALFRLSALLPRWASEAVTRLLKADRVLVHPDPVARAAYEARLAATIAAPSPAVVAKPPVPDPAPAKPPMPDPVAAKAKPPMPDPPAAEPPVPDPLPPAEPSPAEVL